MLKIVFGRSGYGKTEYVFHSIKELVRQDISDILLLTPEQYSLVSERRLLCELGESKIANVDNSSFSRISDAVKRKYGSYGIPVLSKGGKAVLMMQAIESSKESLSIFSKNLDSAAFVRSMIKIYDEMKSCNLNGSEIMSLSAGIKNNALMKKLNDIALIMNTYEHMIADRYLDSADELTRLYEKIKDKKYFAEKTVFIDGFNGFVAQEYKILELIINEADSVTITLCANSFDTDDEFSLFSYVNRSAAILKKIADKANIKCETLLLDKNYRAKTSGIAAVEKNLFSQENIDLCEDGESVKLYCAKSITDECCETSRQIRRLLRKGYRANEIAVIVRDIDKYRDELSAAFKKYEIPFFNDERQPIKCQPIVVFIEYLLRCINYSFRSDDILSLAKTGLVDIDDKDINLLENYVYLWSINGMKWTKPFENSTKGFVSEMDSSDSALLASINKTREKLIAPLVNFKKAVKKANALEICRWIYYTLTAYKADKKISENAAELSKAGCHTLAFQQGAVWDMVMEILSTLPDILGVNVIKPKEFAKLFSIVISTEDLGTLPSGIDNVQIGQADRIRTDNPKAVFVLGANEGEFPQAITGGGLLSESDRRILLENDFKLYSYGEILNIQEKYFAYMACSAASEMLFISYKGSAKDAAPSDIVLAIKSIFSNMNAYSLSDIQEMDLIETRRNAFELMSEKYFVNTAFYSSLKDYFKDDEHFNGVKALAENDDAKINNHALATSLFHYDMFISASRIEDFYNCSFRYFCKFGLNAFKRERAEINPMQRGTLIHYVLEKILSEYGSHELSQMPESDIKTMVDKYLSEYFKTQMGNIADVSIRFKYNYNRLSKLIYGVVFHLAKEFSQCDFEAKAFELNIDKDAPVKPFVLDLEDGGTIQIRGSIDRVDMFEKNNQKYVRVVDYKSGSKLFNLSDIMYGLNLQMLIYLFSISEDKRSAFNAVPAGVLYMHASRNVFSFDSHKEAAVALRTEELNSFKMKGIVISDFDGELAIAMEHDLNGEFIPVKMKKNGELTGQLASLQELGRMQQKVNSLIVQMGMDLHMGKISRNPVKNKTHKSTCDFCDYVDVCANVKNIEHRIVPDLTDSQVKEILAKEYGENA